MNDINAVIGELFRRTVEKVDSTDLSPSQKNEINDILNTASNALLFATNDKAFSDVGRQILQGAVIGGCEAIEKILREAADVNL